MKLKVHVKGIRGSGAIKPGEHAGALFGAILELNGHVFDRINDVQISSGEEFTTVTVTFVPGDLDYVVHTEDSWKALCDQAELDIVHGERAEEAWSIHRADGRIIAAQQEPLA